jgi:hypothetical protein
MIFSFEQDNNRMFRSMLGCKTFERRKSQNVSVGDKSLVVQMG